MITFINIVMFFTVTSYVAAGGKLSPKKVFITLSLVLNLRLTTVHFFIQNVLGVVEAKVAATRLQVSGTIRSSHFLLFWWVSHFYYCYFIVVVVVINVSLCYCHLLLLFVVSTIVVVATISVIVYICYYCLLYIILSL